MTHCACYPSSWSTKKPLSHIGDCVRSDIHWNHYQGGACIAVEDGGCCRLRLRVLWVEDL